jgi:cell division protein ZapA
MAHVSVTINSRNYRMACDDGQEPQLSELAREFDQRIADLRANFGEIGDMRLTVMAALTVADELRDARERLRAAEEEISALQRARVSAADRADTVQAELAAAFNAAADRVEEAARLLSQQSDDHLSAVG